jgi:hypothetical protein
MNLSPANDRHEAEKLDLGSVALQIFSLLVASPRLVRGVFVADRPPCRLRANLNPAVLELAAAG